MSSNESLALFVVILIGLLQRQCDTPQELVAYTYGTIPDTQKAEL